jgi:hypothetical protein
MNYPLQTFLWFHFTLYTFTGAFPKSFLVDKLMIEIDDIDDKFINALSICVIGQNDIDLANILVSTKPLAEEKFSELKEPSRISLYICYTKTERLNQSGLEVCNSKLLYLMDRILV